MGRVLLIGGIGAGKTSLKQMLMNEQVSYRKTQMLDFSQVFIDCPGEYLEIPRFYHVLIDASHQVSEIWALQDATKQRTIYPPKFSKVFRKPIIGIITKVDLPKANIKQAGSYLNYAGIEEPFFTTSIMDQERVAPLRRRLEELNGLREY
ncbi:EutP/PduV family microcompartment system protein [Desulfosporosinus sp. BICA1-9]|uniref:EutP/PduV family microcompartment system protein n=1 Tax=Desulfosporosinus sp. BICA1-9 TaxID=1531958 RepID=UPI00054B98DB|nr:EutP/PduV family microcompartment system protein [Desulfosporosinus sp. BICA1-9]KJS49383.1 MAG: ethanolamine utilization protein [Peptococcaceae bacterium BRH_c23]KJS87934.1 MAG: ethanolamine utilization protein [Desulfosporosinus sp. BICA1-9]HBW35784.1 ethanolamine utilization protein [Desulfosporosinus sp.]